MKPLLFFIFPIALFAQIKSDSVNADVKSSLLRSYYQMNSIVKEEQRFTQLDNEFKSLGIKIRNGQRQEDNGYKWDFNKSSAYNVVGSILNNILNKKALSED